MRAAYDERAKAPEARKAGEVGEHFAELCNIEGIGVSVADDLVYFFGEKHNLEIPEDLEQELTIEAVEAPAAGGSPVAGQTVVLPGTLETMTRRKGQARDVAVGAQVGCSTACRLGGKESGSQVEQR